MATVEELLRATDEVLSDGVRRGALHNIAEDDRLDGRTVTVRGRRLVNFGSCSYLGLELHPALRAGVTDAVERFGTQFSSSRAYLSSPAYHEAEAVLAELFGRPVMISSSTSLGHLAALPTLLAAGDALILDHQVHHSVQLAATVVRAHGATVTLIPHNDMSTLERRVSELARTHRRIWYAADGLYSMYADYAPIDALNALAERHERLWFYLDDAHAVSWSGRYGRGYALERLSPAAAERSVVAASLNKSFATAGGLVTFPDEETRRRVFTLGGPMIFSGPVQPPMLGAVIASARLHFTDEVARRQRHLGELIRLFNTRAAAENLPLVSPSEAPIRCIGAGVPRVAYNLTNRLADAGFFVDTAIFPGVPAKRCGARIALNANHTVDDITGLVEAVAGALPRALAEEGSSPDALRKAFASQLKGREVLLRSVPTAATAARLERHDSMSTMDAAEWDGLFVGRGAFASSGLCAIEKAFAVPDSTVEPEHSWRFRYWIARGADGRAAAATFFTAGLWKDDMLSTPDVSAEVERRRESDPYYLTSTMLAMGTLVTEGNHLYLDRTADWAPALRSILAAARDEEDRVGGSAVVLRDLPDGDPELHEFLLAEGFVPIPIRATWVRELDFADDAAFLAGLGKKARYHQRTKVLAWESRYDVAGLADAAELDQLYRLYRNVHARSLELNVFPLPRRFFDAVRAEPGWEFVVLRLPELGPDPVAFALLHIGPRHVQPILVGLDYRYVASHHTYQQTLWQTIRAGQRHGAPRVLFGMSADLQKSRFGATPRRRWVYVQPTETYHNDVLLRLAEGVSAGSTR